MDHFMIRSIEDVFKILLKIKMLEAVSVVSQEQTSIMKQINVNVLLLSLIMILLNVYLVQHHLIGINKLSDAISVLMDKYTISPENNVKNARIVLLCKLMVFAIPAQQILIIIMKQNLVFNAQ